MKPTKLFKLLLSAVALGIPTAHGLPVITGVVETGGDAEATDTILAQFTGQTFVNGVANEPIAGKAADAPYTVGFFVEEAPMFVDRNHQWNGATTTLPIPAYLLGGEYIMSGNDNRDNAEYSLDITISKESFVYMLVDDRLGDASNANPPNFPNWDLDRSGDGLPDMRWIVDENWEPVKTGHNRVANPDWPDHVGADEGGNGVGPGGDIQNWSSIYTKRIPAGTFTIRAPDNTGQNMYGVVIKAVPDNPTVVASGGTASGFRILISDGGVTTLATNSISLTLGGAAVNASSITATNKITTIVYDSPQPLPSESLQTVVLVFTDSAGTRFTNTINFTVERYISLPPSAAVTDVNTASRGFLVRTHQLETRRHILGDSNRIPPAEEQLAGRIGPNIADPAPFTSNGHFIETTYINYNQDSTGRDDAVSNIGNFSGATTPARNEHPIPGIPGPAASTDNVAVEVLAYVDLPAGWVTMGVNSDDGFRLTVSLIGALRDKMAPAVIEFDGGRGAANTEGRFLVQQAGIYAMRLMWYEGGGGFNAEWYIVQPSGARVLINDPAEATAPKAYYARTGTATDPTHVSVLDPFPFGSTLGAFPDDPIYIEITDGSVPVDTATVQLRVNGQLTTPTVNKTGGRTTINLPPPGGTWAAGNLPVELRYGANSHSYSIPIMNYVTLQECLRTALGTGTTPGMNWRTHQLDSATIRANSVAAAEAQLTNSAANTADLSLAVNGVFPIDYINFEQGGIAAGLVHENQPAPRDAAELPFPGIPGVGTVVPGSLDNIAGEATTYVQFPTAGMYYLGINRDDGFLLTVATTEGGRSLVSGPNVQEIGRVEPGGGIDANVIQNFMAINVPQPGVWPLRLLWFEGNGGAALEWFQTDERNILGLVNDPNVTTTLRAFRSRSAQPPAPDSAACGGGPVEPPGALTVVRTANGITITFDGILQEAAAITGPFTDLAGSSPQTVPVTQAARFYRSRN